MAGGTVAVVTDDPWRLRTYPRGSAAFDRAIFFCDAVFAIALTLVAVEIGVPVLRDGDTDSAGAFWDALGDKGPTLAAFAFAFLWVAFYWRANHRFSVTLRAMDGAYIATLLVYLAFIAGLPFPAAALGEYPSNPAAIAFFAMWAGVISTLEAVLIVVGRRRGLYERPLTAPELRGMVVRSLVPVGAAAVLVAVVLTTSITVAVIAFAAALVAGNLATRGLADPTH